MKKALWIFAALLVIVSAALMISGGLYGWTIFVLVPIALGALGGCFAPTVGKSVLYGMLGVVIPSLALLFLGREGIGCIFMSWIIMMPGGALGGFLAYAIRHRGEWTRAASAFALLPILTVGFDINAKPPTYEVQTSIEINATPERIWGNVVAVGDLPTPTEWFFRTGLAFPTRTRIEGSGVGATRYCEFSTGPMRERVTIWEPGRTLQFDVASSPEPLTEWTLYGHPHPAHLNGYLIAKRGQFRLIAQPGGRTRVEGTSWYQHGLNPAPYWRLWSDAIIHRIHMRVLQHIKKLSEA